MRVLVTVYPKGLNGDNALDCIMNKVTLTVSTMNDLASIIEGYKAIKHLVNGEVNKRGYALRDVEVNIEQYLGASKPIGLTDLRCDDFNDTGMSTDDWKEFEEDSMDSFTAAMSRAWGATNNEI